MEIKPKTVIVDWANNSCVTSLHLNMWFFTFDFSFIPPFTYAYLHYLLSSVFFFSVTLATFTHTCYH